MFENLFSLKGKVAIITGASCAKNIFLMNPKEVGRLCLKTYFL